MIRLLILLVAALAAAFWLGGSLPQTPVRTAAADHGGPGPVARFWAAFAPSERSPRPDPMPAAGSVASVPFSHPVEVGPDGKPMAFAATSVPPAEPAAAAPPLQPAPQAAAAPDLGVFVVTADRVNVREGPSTEFSVLEQLTRGEAVTMVAEVGDGWARIRIEGDGVEGFMAARFLKPE